MAIVYKILYEVNILHEYYLTRADGSNIFELTTASEKQAFLLDDFDKNRDSISSILSFEISRSDQAVFDQYKLKLLPTFSGFKIAIAVHSVSKVGGFFAYVPINPIPDDLSIHVMLNMKSAKIEQITNGRVVRNFASSWFFTNQNVNGFKSFPFLTQAVTAFDPTKSYEQGELAKFDLGGIQSFYTDAEGNAIWDDQIDVEGFANENDRMIVPYAFYYSFNTPYTISKAKFTLYDSNQVVIESLQFTSIKGAQNVYLQFSKSKLVSVTDSGFYRLTVEGNNAYEQEHTVAFHEDAGKFWGMICMKTKVDNAEFNLLKEDRSLISIMKPEGFMDPTPPLFEIPFRSRRTFWRYGNDRRNPIQEDIFTDFLTPISGKLITKKPMPLTHVSTLFKNDAGVTYLPNPKPGDPFRIENNKIYSDILVPESKDLFPIQV
jgi:hypothetical protein